MTKPTLHAQAAELASGEKTPVDLVRASIERAKASGAAFISLREAEALEEAEVATQRRSIGAALGPFDGIPFAAKDLFDIAGTITTAGSETLRGAASAITDAPIIANLRLAGMIPIGKTNLSEFAFSGLGFNPHYGTPTPRRHPAQAPGGSSSGSAIALADGVVAAALGTDTAGSVRLPASFNDIVGFRPSQGRYPSAGIFPLAKTFDVPGPMANTVEDCLILDAVMRGPGHVAADAASAPHFVLDEAILERTDLDPAIRDTVTRFADDVARAGAKVTRKRLSSLSAAAEAIETIGWLGAFEAVEFHRARLAGRDRALIDPRIVARLDKAATMPKSNETKLRRLRTQLMSALADELGEAILITPPTLIRPPLLAPLIADDTLFAATNLQALFLTMVGAYLGMPGLSLPVNESASGARSVLLSAPEGGDDALLATALWASRL